MSEWVRDKSAWSIVYKSGGVGAPYLCRENIILPSDLSTVSAILEVTVEGVSILHKVEG